MITHVAEAGEGRGRVVVELRSARPNRVALAAAFRIARAFGSELESLFVEDVELFDLANFEFSREATTSRRASQTFNAERVERDMKLLAASVRRQMERAAAAQSVPLRFAVVRNSPLQALAAACSQNGPWNLVVLTEPLQPFHATRLARLFETVSDTTGVVLVGPRARYNCAGPIVAVVEHADHLSAAVRSARQLAATNGSDDIVALLVGESKEALQEMETQSRLTLGIEALKSRNDDVTLSLAAVTRGEPGVVGEALACLRPGFVIGRFGGLLMPGKGDLRHVTHVLECPMLLTR